MMRRLSKAVFPIVAACVVVGMAYAFISTFVGSVTSGQAANIESAKILPDWLHQIGFDGELHYAIVRGARGITYFVASHISRLELDNFCKVHGIELIQLGPETTPPVDVALEEDNRLDKEIFRFECTGNFFIFEGESKTHPELWIRVNYCPTTRLITLRITSAH